MAPLRIRRAEAAPGDGPAEFFGRLPESVITDRDLSDEAKVLLAAIHLNIAVERTHPLCLARNEDLAQLLGCTTRSIRRRLVALEERGHLERERIRTIPGSPRGLRPLAKLRGVGDASRHAVPPIGQPSERTPTSGCRRTPASPQPDGSVPPGGHERPPERTPTSAPLLFRGAERKKDPEERPAIGDKPEGSGSPPPVENPEGTGDTPADVAALESLAAQGGPAGRLASAALAGIRARKKSPGPAAKHPPGSEVGDSIPTAPTVPNTPGNRQDHCTRIEHKKQT